MKSLKIGFIADPFHTLDQKTDSTCNLIKTCIKRKHQTFFIDSNSIFSKQNIPYALIQKTSLKKSDLIRISESLEQALFAFDVLFWRKDPPFNMDYIYLTYLLEQIENKVLFINKPSATRNFNEKLSALNFSKFMPETLITKSPEKILSFLKKYKKGIVIKPLDQKGGHGTFFIHEKDFNKEELLNTVTNHGTIHVMAQKFLKGVIKNGDRRALILNGKLLNMMKRIPKKNDFRGNISSGALAYKTTPTKHEQEICSKVGKFFAEKGCHLIGLDLIDGFLTEINITSPIINFPLYPENGDAIYNFIEQKIYS